MLRDSGKSNQSEVKNDLQDSCRSKPEELDLLLFNFPQTHPLLSVCVLPLAGRSPSCEAKLIVKRPSFVEVAPASHRISARHRLRNVSEPQAAEPPAPEPSVAEPPATPEESAPPVPALEPDVIPAPESEDYGRCLAPFLPERVPAIAEEPKPAPDAPAPDEPQPQRAVDEPAQERAPAVDEAAYFDLVPAAPMHTIAEASPRSASECYGYTLVARPS
ncbi:hypothetical protein FB451DRAFT_1516950 [Mycena latifolia]|nr:hypothetical protein FB451DRAFT_1516950 [Mycena latifolia]